jgi:hypothetical protein
MSNLLEGKVFVKISELDATTTFDTNDEFVLVRNGTTVKTAGIDFVDTVVTIGNLATKTYTDAAVAALVAGAPGALDTLNELSAALNNDADFASTVTNQLSLKLDVGDFGLYFWNELTAVTTYHIAEGTNLYYTEDRVDANFATKNTDALTEGTANLYFTDARVLDIVNPLIPITTDALTEGTANLYFTDARVDANFATKNTDALTEGTANLYFTDARVLDIVGPLIPASTDDLSEGSNLFFTTSRARNAISASTGITYNSSTGTIGLTPTPTFTTVTTTNLNVQNVTFTGTGAVNISSGNDLNLSAAGDITFNGNAIGNLAFADNIAFSELINVNNLNGPEKVALGKTSGFNNQGANSIAIGNQAGSVSQGYQSVAIGSVAGSVSQGYQSVAIGDGAGSVNQGIASVAIGEAAGSNSQGQMSVAVGVSAGITMQGQQAVAIGKLAGETSQGLSAIAIGTQAGAELQSNFSVAIGSVAGRFSQGTQSIAIGQNAGYNQQKSQAISIGLEAGRENQGQYSIAVGNKAGYSNQPSNTIILNATGLDLSGVTAQTDSLYIAPIRDTVATTKGLFYNTTTKEVTTATLATVATSGSYNDLSDKPVPNYVQADKASTSMPFGTALPATVISGTITTTGGPVRLHVSGNCQVATGGAPVIQFQRGTSGIGRTLTLTNNGSNLPFASECIDAPTAGTYTYSVKVISGSIGNGTTFYDPVLTIIELK